MLTIQAPPSDGMANGVAIGMLVVAILQAALFVWQLVYMRTSLTDAKAAADAATLAATATQASVDLAKDTAQRQLRAYVTFRRLEISPTVVDEKVIGWNLVPEFRNDGLTPARDVDIRAKWRFAETELPKDFGFSVEGEVESKAVMGSRQTLWTKPIAVKRADLERVRNGTLFVHAWGETTYRDVFTGTEQRYTRFAGTIRVGNLDNPKRAIGFDLLTRHNEAT